MDTVYSGAMPLGRGEALDVYQQLRRLLGEELGLEPTVDAKQLQHQILAS